MIRSALAGLALAALSFAAAAQDSKPIEWVVGYAAGGGSDTVARATADAMSKNLGAPIVINNKPGAATLREKSGLKLTHVPYRGAAPAMQDILGGNVPFMLVDTASGNQFVLGGKVKAIGVASAKRIATLPNVPTLMEQGLAGFEAYAWQGLSVPSGTPAETVARLNKALVGALESTPVKARFQALGVEPLPGSSAQMASYVKSERERWGRLIRDNNIKLD